MEFTTNGDLTNKDSRGVKAIEIITPLDINATLTVTTPRGRVAAKFAHTATNDPAKTGGGVLLTHSANKVTLAGQTTFPDGKFEVDIQNY